MAKITMLGTGSGGTMDLYNTCFTISNEDGVFLVDTGGSIEIVKRLKMAGIKLSEVRNIFVSHSHTDHILGLIWLFKKIGVMAMHGEVNYNINIYCNDVVYAAIKGVASYVLPKPLIDSVYSVVNFVVLNDGDKYIINGNEYEFFDILARGTKQFGFSTEIDDERLVFLGDETLNPILIPKISGADYVMHEAFCLYKEENIFHAYEKHHSTALSAAKTLSNFDIKNLILYHTEESHKENRKELYTVEAQSVFPGNVLVPDDLEVLEIGRNRGLNI